MTKEQALAILKQPGRIGCHLIKANDEESNKYNQESIEALNMAIEALEQQPSDDDCVSRKAVDLLCFKYLKPNNDDNVAFYEHFCDLPPVTPAQNWIPLVWDEYPTVDSDGNDDYVYAVDYSVPMPKEDEWVLVTDENHNVVKVQYDGYDFGDYARENILAWQPLPQPYEEK